MVLAILQARCSSSRLSQKVLLPILGVPMLLRQLERVQRSEKIDTLVVATSTDLTDDAIEKLCADNNIACFRGSHDDVLDRYYQAASVYQPNHIVRLTGDCPVVDPKIIDDTISFYFQGFFDYASNTLNPTFPDGMDVEVFSFNSLKSAWEEAKLLSEREHVTPFIHKQPNRFKLGNYSNKDDLSHLRLTVDEPQDYVLIKAIYDGLYNENKNFDMYDIVCFLEKRQDLLNVNSLIKRNEGYAKSLREDARV